MKASNWHYTYVRHTRTVNRVSHEGSISAFESRIELKTEHKHMTIDLTEDEIAYLKEWLNKIK